MTGPAQQRGPATLLVVTALAVGAALWLLAAAASGRREPWDGPYYWPLAYPAALLLSGMLGWGWPRRWVLGPMLLFQGQFLGAVLQRGGDPGNLWPVAMAMFAAIALPGVGLAWLASRLQRRGDVP